MPEISDLAERVGGPGASAWDIHSRAVEAKERGEDVIVLSVGDPDFETPFAIRDAAKAALDGGDTHYVDVRGRERLRAMIAEQHQRRTGQAVDASNVVIVPGAQCGLFCSSLVIADGDCELITTDPVYTTYEATLRASGARMVSARQTDDGRFYLDAAALEAALTSRTRGLFIPNPNNPTGVVLSTEEMRAVADFAVANDIWIVADEVYADLVYEGEFRFFAEFPELHDRLISVSSFSKSYAMTGWRVGWVIAPRPVADHIENLLLSMLYGMPGFVQSAAITALKDCQSAIVDMREIYRRRRDLLLDGLSGIDSLSCVKPAAGMFLMVDVRGTGMTSGDFVEALFEATGVAVMDGAAFGEVGAGFVRISFTNSEQDLAEACRRMTDWLSVPRHAAG